MSCRSGSQARSSSGAYGRRSGGRPDALNGGVEVPEPFTGHRCRDLGPDAERDDGLMGDQEPAGLVHRRQHRLDVEGRHGAEIDDLHGDAFARSSPAAASASWTMRDTETTVTSDPSRTTAERPMGRMKSAGGCGPFMP